MHRGVHQDKTQVARVINPEGKHRIVLICEHASAHIPGHFDNLGLDQNALTRHIAWDPGALDTAKHLSTLLDAPLVFSQISRLVYDCNRPPEARDAMPAQSEIYEIAGNQNLTEADKDERIACYYRPFERLVSETLDTHGLDAVVVTVHSFTPIYKGVQRDVEIGILHDADDRLALAMMDIADGFDVRLNEPYGAEDGVTHTLKHHAAPRGLLNVMLEIRNDLIASSDQCAAMASTLGGWLQTALREPISSPVRKAVP